VSVDTGAARFAIDRIRMRTLTRLANGEAMFLREALHRHTAREWRDPKARTVPKYDLAVLYDPNEKLPPSSPTTIKHLARIAEKLSFDFDRQPHLPVRPPRLAGGHAGDRRSDLDDPLHE
jgi:hypothetical protein